jgi:hypothetical protein
MACSKNLNTGHWCYMECEVQEHRKTKREERKPEEKTAVGNVSLSKLQFFSSSRFLLDDNSFEIGYKDIKDYNSKRENEKLPGMAVR